MIGTPARTRNPRRSARIHGLAAFSAAWLLIVGISPALAQRELKVIPDPDPELERQTFQLAEGLEVNLYAADPLLAKPIHINFDAQGRLWVASSEVYPHVKPGQQPSDKILVLEDTNGDGKAEKTTVFADGLLIPTGVEPGDGGAYVANSTEILHLKDTNGDGKADSRRVMLSGFGTEDTHHIVHTFRWGPDGMLYFNQSIYIHSHIETPHGVRRLNSGGIWQFRPETMQLEVFARGLCNPWGHIFDRWGQSFATDGAGGEGINYVFPGVTMFTYAGATKVLQGLNPGSPKDCGLEVISGRHFPDDWQGSLVTNDFRAHRVCRYVLTETGSGYASREQTEIIKSKHTAFRPIDAKMGPDGALYIADWYNPIIQHGEVDFRDDRRDHTHGRIWRVTFKDRPLVERPQLVNASVDDLLKSLTAPEDFTRLHAKLQLKARGAKEVLPKLANWTASIDAASADAEHQRLEALWTYQALDVTEPKLLDALLHSNDHHVRAAATRVLSAWRNRVPNTPTLLAPLAEDPHPQVRLEAVRALAELKTPGAVEVAMRALDHPVDRFLDHALWLTARDLEPYWLPALEAGQLTFGGNTRHLTYVLQAAGSARVVAPLVALLQAGKVPADRQDNLLVAIGQLGGPGELRFLFDKAIAPQTPPATRAHLLAALTDAARQRKVVPAGELNAVAALIDSPEVPIRIAALRAAGAWHLEAQRDKLLAIASAPDTADSVRHAAFDGLASLGPNSGPALLKLSAEGPKNVRELAIAALGALDVKAATQQLVQYIKAEPTADPAAIVLATLDRKGGSPALVAALKGQQLSPDAAKLAIRAVRSAAREEPEVVAAFTAAGGIAEGPRALTPDQLTALIGEVSDKGNAARGEAIFRRSQQGCLKCHSIAGAGGRVGPDLVSIGASAQVDYLIESILQPSAKIKENYHSLTVVADGLITSGVKIRETDKEIVLRDLEDREVSVPLDTIEAKKEGGSLMPVGLVDDLTRGELVDLVRFLSELGKVGPFAVDKARVVRRWQALLPGPEAVALLNSSTPANDDPNLNWTPIYSTVAGSAPVSQIPAVEVAGGKVRLVRAQVEVATPGKVDLQLQGPVEHIWLDGQEVTKADKVSLDLAVGVHTVTLRLADKPDNALRVELLDAPGSAAQVQIVGGK